MIENFTQYWEKRKDLLEKLGVTIEVASMIWDDAVTCIGVNAMVNEIKENNKII